MFIFKYQPGKNVLSNAPHNLGPWSTLLAVQDTAAPFRFDCVCVQMDTALYYYPVYIYLAQGACVHICSSNIQAYWRSENCRQLCSICYKMYFHPLTSVAAKLLGYINLHSCQTNTSKHSQTHAGTHTHACTHSLTHTGMHARIHQTRRLATETT